MPSIFTLEGPRRKRRKAKSALGDTYDDLGRTPEIGKCKCMKNGRPLCYVGKSKKHPSGWAIKPGKCRR